MSSIKLIADLNQYFLQHYSEIEDWFARKRQLASNIFYCSVDLRNDGTKVVPVDTNLFPAGFNILSSASLDLGVEVVRKWFAYKFPNVNIKKILIISENHTRNMPYYANVAALCDILKQAGFEVRIGSMIVGQVEESKNIKLENREISLEALWRKDNMVGVGNFSPEMILLNNDLSEGIPEILKNLQQLIIPSFSAGWFNRTKSVYFKHYQEVSAEFANFFNFDPWQISSLFDHCEGIDFMQQSGMDCIKNKTTQLLQSIQDKYSEYNLASKPFVFVKTDAGSYGMGVMAVDSVEQLQKLNRRQRTHMSTTKGGVAVQKVIIQEGVYTTEFLGADAAPAEPVMYMLGSKVIGSFYRMNSNCTNDQNLNSPGMQFMPLNNEYKFYYVYSVIALLAQLAAARELESYAR